MSIIKANEGIKGVIIMILLARDPPVFRNKKQQITHPQAQQYTVCK
jgi:hypothetical protein